MFASGLELACPASLTRGLTSVVVFVQHGKVEGVCGFVRLLVMFYVLCWSCSFGCGFCFGCLW